MPVLGVYTSLFVGTDGSVAPTPTSTVSTCPLGRSDHPSSLFVSLSIFPAPVGLQLRWLSLNSASCCEQQLPSMNVPFASTVEGASPTVYQLEGGPTGVQVLAFGS